MKRIETRVHLTDCGDDQSPQPPCNNVMGPIDSNNELRKEGLNIFLQFTEKNLVDEYNAYQKTDVNIFLSFLMGGCMVIYFVVHLTYQIFWRTSNPFYIPAFIMGTIATVFGGLLVNLRMAVFLPPFTFRSPVLRRIHQWHLDLDRSPVVSTISNTTFVISFSVAVSLFVLARVVEGPCDPGNMDWRAQQDCNNGRLTGLPTEEYVLNLFSVLLVQVFVKGASTKAILFAWVAKFCIIMSCLYVSQSTTYWWVIYHFCMMAGISYEVSGW